MIPLPEYAAAGNDRLWKTVCDVVGTPELAVDPRFLTTSDRATNQDALKPLLEARFAGADAEEWLARFRSAGVPSAPIYRYGEVLEDPQVSAYGWVQPMTLPNGVGIQTFGPPIGMTGLDFPIRDTAPAFDGNREEIVAWLDSQ